MRCNLQGSLCGTGEPIPINKASEGAAYLALPSFLSLAACWAAWGRQKDAEQAHGRSVKWRGTPHWTSCLQHPCLQDPFRFLHPSEVLYRVRCARKPEVSLMGP